MVDDGLDASGLVFSHWNLVCEITLAAILSEQFSKFSDAPALTYEATTLSYDELDTRTGALAADLVARGVGPDVTVAICLPRSAEQIIALLAVIRAGGAYVPLNPEDPEVRRHGIIDECAPKVLLAETACGDTPLLRPADWPDSGVCPDPADVGPNNLALVLFTSGSTGKPKGVLIEHDAVINSVSYAIDRFEFGPGKTFLHKSPMSFDISAWEVFVPLLSGGEVVIAPEGAQRDPREILSLIRQHGVSAVFFVPTMLNLFLDVLDEEERVQIDDVIVGGEALQTAQRTRVHQLMDTELCNIYGPTEATVCVTTWPANKDDATDPLPIGRPVWNSRLYVLDEDGKEVPQGEVGRLWLAGRQLARGYLNRDDLTAERFVADPFHDGERMYDSGDLAAWDNNGALIYHGRADTQIKLRGIRLEMGEIEAALEEQPGIKQAAVVARDDLGAGDMSLVAFCTGDTVDETELRTALTAVLPAHAVPSRIIGLEAFPLTTSGKVDRPALKARPVEPVKKAAKSRGTGGNTARVIADALAGILNIDGSEIDRSANFFDLGASSLHLARLREALRQEIQKEFPVSDFFLYTSIDALAAHLDGVRPDVVSAKTKTPASEPKSDQIAIVGMAGRFPGAPSVEAYWQGLVEGRELISQFSEEELEVDPREGDPSGTYVLARGTMPDPAMFDAKHFDIPPREADRLDPQHRIMLEVAQTALEDAGHDPDRFPGRIGIFCGASQSSYLLNNLLGAPGASRDLAAGYPVKDFSTLFGNDKEFLATRLAYKLNLTGPAMTVQTACSTALTAVTQAITALRSGQADMALAGGVSVTFPTKRPYSYLPEGMASADGHCRTFDAEASGTVFGDGAGLVVLRRLDDALADGDEVIAVIRGVGINNDGAEKAGYAAPSIRAQSEVIQAAHKAAGISPRQIGYVEAHGTATPLGDPIEFTALQMAFGAGTEDRSFCAVGSAKTNIGHLDIAAGAAGLIKTALVLKKGLIPPLLHYTAPNPQIDFDSSAFYPVTELTKWEPGEAPRLAGVSAFGVGGTNVHLVLEEAPETPVDAVEETDTGLRVFPISGSSPEAVAGGIANLGAYAEAHPTVDPDRVIATLREGRRQFAQRSVLVARNLADLATVAATHSGKPAKAAAWSELAFLFPGQGAQHVGMGKHLFEEAPVFRAALTTCTELLAPKLGLDLLEIIHAPEAKAEEMTERLRDTSIAQPAIFATSYALAKQWDHWGIAPDVMVGHSIGEFVAATLAGVMDLPDALDLIALRGRLMADLPRGVMISVRACEEEIAPYLGTGLDLAAVNGAKAVVVAGPEDAAAEILPKMEADGLIVSRLHTSHAFHSHMMDPALAPFEAAVAKLTLTAPQTPILSTVTGDWLTEQEATTPAYWANHMRRPVRFFDAIQTLWTEGRHLFLEAGPGRTLSTLAGQNPDRRAAQPALASLPHAQSDNADSHVSMLDAFGRLWAHGYSVDWARIDEGRKAARRLPGLPTYPFQRTRHWIEPVEISGSVEAPSDSAPLDSPETQAVVPMDAGTAVRAMLSDLSGIDPTDMDGSATFLELGFDSLLLTQATREITDRFAVAVTLRQLMDGLANIDTLAAHIEANGTLSSKGPADKTKIGWMAEMDRPEPAKPMEASSTSAPVTSIAREADTITPEQRAHIDGIVGRFNEKTSKSKELTQEYRPYHADPRTASGFNRLWKEGVYQIVSDRSKGSRFVDIDGNEYVDLLNGFGPGFLGHNNDLITGAITERMERGFEVGPQHIEAMEAAKLFCEVTGNDRASFVCTGSEAVYAAMRLARTVTNRDTIVVFERDYHGNFDEVLVRGVGGANGPRTLPLTPGIPRDSVKNVVALPYGTPEALDWIRANADRLAAVIIEPVQSRRPEFRPVDFVRELRVITEHTGALFIFDEVVTGFRFGPRGAQAFYGVDADLVTYGKVVGGEMPVGVVAGKARYMDTFDGGQWAFGDDSFPEAPVTFFAGTFVRHPLAMAAVRAMLLHLKAQPDFYWRSINAKGDELAGTLNRWFENNDMPFAYPNCGSLMYLRIGEDQKFGGLLGLHLRARGVFLLEGFPSYLTAAHDAEDIAFAIDAIKDAALEMRGDGMLTGRETQPYDGPKVFDAPPRLSLPNGTDVIAAQMSKPITPPDVPTTSAQQELWTAQVLHPEMAAGFNENYTIELRGPGIDIDLLHAAVEDATARHDALTATIGADGERMSIGTTVPEIARLDFSDTPDPGARLAGLWSSEAGRSFDLENGPLARFRIVRRAPDAVDLMITAHHIVFDGWSGGTILRDICRLYAAKIEGTPAKLPEISSPYDYARAERDWLDSTAGHEAKAFWTDKFADLPATVALPTDRPRAADRDVSAAREDIVIPAETVATLRQAASGMGVTLFSLLFAGYKLFAARATASTDLTVAVPSAGQPVYQLENLVFHCVNLMPVRSKLEPQASFQDFVKNVGLNVLEASEHQQLTYGSIVRALNMPRETTQTPLTSMIFNLDPAFTDAELDFAGVPAAFRSIPRQFSNFEISLNITDRHETLEAEWTYQTARFGAETIQGFMSSYLDLLLRSVERPDAPLSELLAATDAERASIARDGNREGDDVDDTPVPQRVAERARIHGDALALTLPETGETLSYGTLNERADRIAAVLSARGVEAGDIVAVLMDRRADLVASFLAILKLGAAYLPLDPEAPPERLRYMLTDAQAKLAIVCSATQTLLGSEIPVFDLDAETDTLATTAPVWSTPRIKPADRAYVIYTSGSTGQPKGVEVSHLNLSNLVDSFEEAPGLGPDDTVLAHTTVAFDMSVADFWAPLSVGATIALITREATKDPNILAALIETADVTVMTATPSLYRMLLESGWAGKPDLCVTASGEMVHQDLVDQLLAKTGKVWVRYGPTEATVFCTIAPMTVGGRVSIGRPNKNTEIRVLGADDRPTPLGVPGEIVIGGEGVALGYLNRPDLTEEKFAVLDGKRFYRSGDIGRWVIGKEGRLTLDILGRTDGQIKLRGYRIEIGEIETAIMALDGIARAAVVLLEADTPDAYLAAGIVRKPNATGDEVTWRRTLETTLPAYMVPARLHVVDALPLNMSGKTDRRALTATLAAEVDGDLTVDSALEDSVQRMIAIWQKSFHGREIGPDDNFFEIGGHSLMAVSLFQKVRRDFGHDLPIGTLLSHQTPRALAAALIGPDHKQDVRPTDQNASTLSDPRPWDTSVIIHPGPADTTGRPFFFLGGVGGNVNNLYELGQHLGQKRPAVGFQTRGVLGHTPHDTIEAMAAENIRYMRQHQSTGPYIFAGYSGGAFTALEMARQLEAMGEEVGGLLILDSYAPNFSATLMQSYKPTLRERFEDEYVLLRGHGINTLLRRAKSKGNKTLARAINRWGGDYLNVGKVRLNVMRDVWIKASSNYVGRPIQAPITLFNAAPTSPSKLDVFADRLDPTFGWSALTRPGAFQIVQAMGEHKSLLSGECAADLATKLEAAVAGEYSAEAAE